MKKQNETEKASFVYSSEEDFKLNVTNNIRWLYIELYDAQIVCNVKSFAEKCHTPQSTVESWLRDGVVPQPEARQRLETCFGKREGSLVSEGHPFITNWKEEYYLRIGAKPSMRKYRIEQNVEPVVAEKSQPYSDAEKDLLTLCEELLKHPELMATNPKIRSIVQKWT